MGVGLLVAVVGGGIAYDLSSSAVSFLKRAVGVDVAAKGKGKAAANEEAASGTKVAAEEMEAVSRNEGLTAVDITVETKGKSATNEVSTGAGDAAGVRSSLIRTICHFDSNYMVVLLYRWLSARL